MKKYNYIIFIVVLASFIISCEKDIDINIKDPEAILVVDAVITTENKKHSINLSENIGYFEDGSVKYVTEAYVRLIGDNEEIEFLDSGNGNYIAEKAFSAKRGVEYTLQINWNNILYDAKSLLPNEEFLIDTILCLPEEGNVINLDEEDSLEKPFIAFIFGEEPGPIYHHYAVEVRRNNEPVDFNEIFAFDDYYFNDTYIYGYPILFFTCNKYKDSVDIYFYPVDEKYKDYIGEIKSNVNATFDPFFSPVPPPIHGNISNNGMGYFLVTEYYKTKFVWDEEEFNND